MKKDSTLSANVSPREEVPYRSMNRLRLVEDNDSSALRSEFYDRNVNQGRYPGGEHKVQNSN